MEYQLFFLFRVSFFWKIMIIIYLANALNNISYNLNGSGPGRPEFLRRPLIKLDVWWFNHFWFSYYLSDAPAVFTFLRWSIAS